MPDIPALPAAGDHDPVPALLLAYQTIRAAEHLNLLTVPALDAWGQLVEALNQEAGPKHQFHTDLSASVPYAEPLSFVDDLVEELLRELPTVPDPLLARAATDHIEEAPAVSAA